MKKNNEKQKRNVKVCMDKKLSGHAERVNNDELGTIIYLGSKKADMCEVSFETDEKTFLKIAEIGKELIEKDREKLFGYAIVRAIEDVVAEEKSKGKKCSKT